MLRTALASVAVGCLLGSSSFAEISGIATPSRNPTGNPAAPFALDTDLNAAPNDGWVSFVLSLTSNVSEHVMTGIEARIAGNLLQRWEISGDVTPTPNSLDITSGDSHLMAPANALVGVAFTENNNFNNGVEAIPADSATRDYGVGSSLFGSWGIPHAQQSALVNFAYIVVPKGAVANGKVAGLDLSVLTSTPGGQAQRFTEEDFYFSLSPENDAPVITPLVQDSRYSSSTRLSALDAETPRGELVWSHLTADPANPGKLPGVPNSPEPTLTDHGSFYWNHRGWRAGTHRFIATVTDGGNPALSTTDLALSVIVVPEPATLAMSGLALVGCVIAARCRS
jgi:hypothetical protein